MGSHSETNNNKNMSFHIELSPIAAGREDAVPAWAELLAVGLVLLYQTCDALDGLQARRTGTSSALGELLDHSLDCVCLTAFTFGYCCSQRLGFGATTVVSLVVSWVPWWLAQWEAYHTGVVRTGGALFGITEIELVVASIHVISAVAGPEVWRLRLPSLSRDGWGVELRYVCMGIQLSVAAALSALSARSCLAALEGRAQVAAALRRALPLATLAGFAVLWPLTLPALHPGLLCLAVSGLYTRQATELVLCHMTREEYPSRNYALVMLPVVYSLGLAGLLDGPAGLALFGLYALFCVWDALLYAADAAEEVADHLGACLLRVGKRGS